MSDSATGVVLILFLLGIYFLIPTHTFPGDSDVYLYHPGFFQGLWHGAVALGSITVGAFSKVDLFARDGGWWYQLGFLIGCLAFSWNVGILCVLCSFVMFVL